MKLNVDRYADRYVDVAQPVTVKTKLTSILTNSSLLNSLKTLHCRVINVHIYI